MKPSTMPESKGVRLAEEDRARLERQAKGDFTCTDLAHVIKQRIKGLFVL